MVGGCRKNCCGMGKRGGGESHLSGNIPGYVEERCHKVFAIWWLQLSKSGGGHENHWVHILRRPLSLFDSLLGSETGNI